MREKTMTIKRLKTQLEREARLLNLLDKFEPWFLKELRKECSKKIKRIQDELKRRQVPHT